MTRSDGLVAVASHASLTLESSSLPSALAAPLLHARAETGCIPRIYFEWTEGGPFADFLSLFLFGQDEVAPVTRETGSLRGNGFSRCGRGVGGRGSVRPRAGSMFLYVTVANVIERPDGVVIVRSPTLPGSPARR